MKSNTAGFKEWLSGKCRCSDPPYWRCQISPDRIEIVPGWKLFIVASIMLVGFSGIPGYLFWSIHTEWDFFGIAGMLISGGVGIVGVGASGFLLVTVLIEQVKGPYFLYFTSDRKLRLPRELLVMPRENAIGWRLVTGNWIGADGNQKKQDFPISELQLIVKTADGLIALVVVGSKAYAMTEQSRQVAHSTGLPLQIIDQHQGVTDIQMSKRM